MGWSGGGRVLGWGGCIHLNISSFKPGSQHHCQLSMSSQRLQVLTWSCAQLCMKGNEASEGGGGVDGKNQNIDSKYQMDALL